MVYDNNEKQKNENNRFLIITLMKGIFMKIRSYYALILLLSCITPSAPIHAENQENQDRARSTIIEATSVTQLENIIANNDQVVVDFYASWCGPCKKMAPEFAKLPREFSDVVFVKISVDLAGVTETFKIKSMPTVMYYKNGAKVSQTMGSKTFEALKNQVNTVYNS